MMNNCIIKYDQMRLILNTSELKEAQNTVVLAISRQNTKNKVISCSAYFGYEDYINQSQLNLKSTVSPLNKNDGSFKSQAEACADTRCEILCTLSLALEIINYVPDNKAEPKSDFEDNLRHSMVNTLIGSGILTLVFNRSSSTIVNRVAQGEKKDTHVIDHEKRSPSKTAFKSMQMNLEEEEKEAIAVR